VLGGDPRSVEGVVQHHPQRDPSAAVIRLPGAGTGPEGVGGSPPSAAYGEVGGGAGVAAETGGRSPRHRATHGARGGERGPLDREAASCAVDTVIPAGELLSCSVR
jgi:hypothetical protein